MSRHTATASSVGQIIYFTTIVVVNVQFIPTVDILKTTLQLVENRVATNLIVLNTDFLKPHKKLVAAIK